MPHIASTPYPWPYDGALRADNTALVVIDMQTDFCGVGGYVDAMGYDLSLTRAPIGPISRLLAAFRARLEAMTVLPMLLERTTRLEAAEVGPWLPSVLARRYEYLELAVE